MSKTKLTTVIVGTATILVTTLIIIKNMEPKDYWVCGAYPVCVNQEVAEGYKVMGTFKLWNPHPHPITFEDADFIKSKLSEWLAEHYPEYKIDIPFQQINNRELINKLHYAFTMFHEGGTAEADFYLLTLHDKEKKIKIYIGKGIDTNTSNPPLTLKLIYPFYDEEWHRNIDNPAHYHPSLENWQTD